MVDAPTAVRFQSWQRGAEQPREVLRVREHIEDPRVATVKMAFEDAAVAVEVLVRPLELERDTLAGRFPDELRIRDRSLAGDVA